MAWLRLYDTILDDPKIQMLSDRAFRMLVNLWCLAKRNGGKLTGDINSLAFSLRMPTGKVRDTLQALISANLIDRIENGYEPHDWNIHQYQSDVSTERVKRFRERSSKQDATVTETPPDTEAETEQNRAEKKRAVAPVAIIPDWVPPEAWKGFVEMRAKIRAPLTARASTLLVMDLVRLRAAGHDPGAVLEQSIMRSWRGLFPVEVKNDRGKSGTQQQGRGSREAADLALAAIKRAEAANSASRAKQPIAGASDCIDGTARTISDGGTNPRALEPPGRGVSLPSPDNRGKSGAESSVLHRYEAPAGMENQGGVRAISAQREEQILPNSGPIARAV